MHLLLAVSLFFSYFAVERIIRLENLSHCRGGEELSKEVNGDDTSGRSVELPSRKHEALNSM